MSNEHLTTRARSFIGAASEAQGEAHTIIQQLVDEVERLESEVKDLQFTFDLQFDASKRAVRYWQSKNPGNDLVWPDAEKLQVWLMDEIERLRKYAPLKSGAKT